MARPLLAKYGESPEDEPREESLARNQKWAKPGPYITKLSDADEREFQKWARSHPDLVEGELDTPTPDYDVRGRWLAEKQGDPEAKLVRSEFDGKLHASDKWKTPYDAVFSRESIYAKPNAPRWDGDRLIAHDGTVIVDETPKTNKEKKAGETTAKTASVPIIAPDGQAYMIPLEDLTQAFLHGGKPAIRMAAPDGEQYWVPADQAEAGVQHGGKIVQNDGSEYEKGTAPTIVGHNAAGQPIWGTDEQAATAAAEGEGNAGGFVESFGNALKGAIAGIGKMLDPRLSEEEKQRHLDSLYDDVMYPFERLVTPAVDSAQRAIDEAKNGRYSEAAGHALAAAVPLVGPWAADVAENAGKQIGAGNYAGAAGTLAGNAAVAAAPEVAPELAKSAVETAKSLPARAAEVVAPTETLDKPVAPGDLTPRERWEAANKMGVNLDLAQATNAKIPAGAKKVTEHSLTGSGKFETNTAGNVEALHAQSAKLLNDTAPPMERAEFGDAAKRALLEHQQDLNERASNLYEALDERVGDKLPELTDIRSAAQKIIDDNGDYYEKHPELLKGPPGKAWTIIEDLAGKPAKPKAGTGVLDAQGKPVEGTAEKAPDTWSDLHRLRSDLLDLYRSPEFTGDRPTGWLKQMVGVVDQTMNDADKTPGLTDEDQRAFRAANSLYERMKQTYDDPRSPFYSIVRADGSVAADSLSRLRPENVMRFREAMSDMEHQDLSDQLQRQTMSRLIDPAGNGTPDLKNFASRWNRAQKETVGGVLSPEQMKSLDELASVARTVNLDTNPSGTAKVVQPVSEASGAVTGTVGALTAGHPVIAAVPAVTMAAQRGVASALTSPDVVRGVMEHQAPPSTAPDLSGVNPVRSAVTAAPAAAANEPSTRDRFADMTRQREGVSTPPNGGQITNITSAEPNEVHDPAAEAAAMARLKQQQPTSPQSTVDVKVETPLSESDRKALEGPAQPVAAAVPAQASPPPQSKLEPPEGATHEVLGENGETLGHIVDGEYVPLEAATA